MNVNDIKPGMRLAVGEVWEIVRAVNTGEICDGMVIENPRGIKFWGRKLHPQRDARLQLICLDAHGWEHLFSDYEAMINAGLLPHLKPAEPDNV